jgi:hypothetical protein
MRFTWGTAGCVSGGFQALHKKSEGQAGHDQSGYGGQKKGAGPGGVLHRWTLQDLGKDRPAEEEHDKAGVKVFVFHSGKEPQGLSFSHGVARKTMASVSHP